LALQGTQELELLKVATLAQYRMFYTRIEMDNHSINIVNATEFYVLSIINLFKSNYRNYHYTELMDEDSLKESLKNGLIGWIAREGSRTIGFAGLYYDYLSNPMHIKLAHLLVDKNYRGRKVGDLLEQKRANFYNKLKNVIVFASCVDKPEHSLKMKEKLGFVNLGFRKSYRPVSEEIGSNSILMAKYSLSSMKNFTFPYCSDKTIKLIESKSLLCGFKVNFKKNIVKISNNINKGIVEIIENPLQGRIRGNIGNSQVREDCFLKAVERIKYSQYRYKAFELNVLGDQFVFLDMYLLTNGFSPIVFIPYFTDNICLIEYQLVGEEEGHENSSDISTI
jgi:GNAT superfamily N-acetyltransferase